VEAFAKKRPLTLNSFKGILSQKLIHMQTLLTYSYYVNIKEELQQKSRLLRSHWDRGNQFWRFPNRISRRIRSHMRNVFSPWIRWVDRWKNRGSKISWHCPFNNHIQTSKRFNKFIFTYWALSMGWSMKKPRVENLLTLSL
jgi:hypothetical protein